MTEHIVVEDSFVQSLVEQAAWDTAKVPLAEKKDSGQKKGDKGKDKDDPKAKDFEDGGDRKGDKGAKGKKDDKPDFTTGARKGDKSKTHKGKDFEDDDEDRADEYKAGGSPYDTKGNTQKPVPDSKLGPTRMKNKKTGAWEVVTGDEKKKRTGRDDSGDKNEAVEVHMCPLCESVLEEELTDEQIQEHVAQIQEHLFLTEQDDDDTEPTDADLDAIEREREIAKKRNNEQSNDPDDPANKEKVARVAAGESDFDKEGLDSKKRTGPVSPGAAKAHQLALKGMAKAKQKVGDKVKSLKASVKGSY